MLCCFFCSSTQYCSWIERHWCCDRPSAFVWVAVEVTAVGVSQSHKERELSASCALRLGGDRACGDGKPVTLCCSTELLGRTDRLSSELAELPDVLHASSLCGTTQSRCCSSYRCTSARNLVGDLKAARAWKCNGDAQPSVRWLPHGWRRRVLKFDGQERDVVKRMVDYFGRHSHQ